MYTFLDTQCLTTLFQLFFTYLIWGTVVSVGSLSGLSGKRFGKRSAGVEEDYLGTGDWVSSSWQGDHYGQPRTSVELTDTEFLAALDSAFTFASSTKQFVVNSISVSWKTSYFFSTLLL